MSENVLISILNELNASAAALQGSLLARDTESIWTNLERQERSLSRLGLLHKEEGAGMDERVSGDPEARRLLRRGLTIVQANRALSQRFLEVVGNTFARLCGGGSTYAAAGTRGTPMLVRQQG